jgi:hypothetical protein
VYHKGGYVTFYGSVGDKHNVIWEIILRDFWGAIFRHLITSYRRSNANARAGAFEYAPLRSLRPRNLPDKKKRKIISQITAKRFSRVSKNPSLQKEYIKYRRRFHPFSFPGDRNGLVFDPLRPKPPLRIG